MNIYLTRHGQTEWNLIGRIQGYLDSPLTKKGMDDAINLGKNLRDIKFDVAYTSTQYRAIHTAELILDNPKVKIIPLEDLRELSVGIWEGMLLEDIKKNYSKEFEIYTTDPSKYVPVQGGEGFKEFEKRVSDFVEELKNSGAQNVLIVTHGLTYMMLLNLFENRGLDSVVERRVPPGTALTTVHYDGEKFEILEEGNSDHLK